MLWVYVVSATRPEDLLYSYGPLGIGVVALSTVLYKMFNIILKDRDKAIADRDRLLEDVFTKVIPAVARNTEVLQARQEIDRALVDMTKESGKQIQANNELMKEISAMLRYGRRDRQSEGG